MARAAGTSCSPSSAPRASSPELRVVSDQLGAPTSSPGDCTSDSRDPEAPLSNDRTESTGIYHMSASGQATWYEFAVAILAEAGLPTPVVPISSGQIPTAARRPSNSLLDNSKLAATFRTRLPSWQEQLSGVMAELRRA